MNRYICTSYYVKRLFPRISVIPRCLSNFQVNVDRASADQTKECLCDTPSFSAIAINVKRRLLSSKKVPEYRKATV